MRHEQMAEQFLQRMSICFRRAIGDGLVAAAIEVYAHDALSERLRLRCGTAARFMEDRLKMAPDTFAALAGKGTGRSLLRMRRVRLEQCKRLKKVQPLAEEQVIGYANPYDAIKTRTLLRCSRREQRVMGLEFLPHKTKQHVALAVETGV